MADLLVVSFPAEPQAEDARERLLAMQKEYLIELGDAVVAVKRPDGTVKPNQLFSPTAAGAASGALWGTLIGTLFLLIRKVTADKVLAEFRGIGATVMRSSFDETKEAALREALAAAQDAATAGARPA